MDHFRKKKKKRDNNGVRITTPTEGERGNTKVGILVLWNTGWRKFHLVQAKILLDHSRGKTSQWTHWAFELSFCAHCLFSLLERKTRALLFNKPSHKYQQSHKHTVYKSMPPLNRAKKDCALCPLNNLLYLPSVFSIWPLTVEAVWSLRFYYWPSEPVNRFVLITDRGGCSNFSC